MPQAVDEAGNVWETDAQGNPVRFIGKQGGQRGGVFNLPPNPRQVQQDAMEAERLRLAQEAAARAAANDGQSNARAVNKETRDQIEFAAKFNPDGTPKATLDQTREDRDRGSRLNQLIGQINRVQELFNKDINPTSGVWGVKDYLPTDENARFDTAGAALSQQGLAAFRVPGTGTVSDRDAMMFDRANLPTASTRDSSIEEQLRGLRARVDEETKALGLPPVKWQGVFDQSFVTGNNPQAAAGYGATQTADQVPPAMQEAHRAFVASNLGKPGFTDAYVNFRIQMDRQNGFQSDPDTYRAWAQDVEKNARGNTTNADIAPIPRKMSGAEQLRNNAVNNPVGAAVAGFADAGSFGIPSALAGDQMRALGDAQPWAMAGGQIAGSIGATTGMGRIASLGLDSLARAPRMAGLAARARNASPFVKSLAGDTAYSAAYGANTGQDPLASAALGAVGSTAGQGAGSVLGKVAAGAKIPRSAAALRARGIPLTVGQQMGGIAKSLEDKMTSMPIVGDMIARNRQQGVEAFNRAVLEQAGAPVGARVQGIGETGVQSIIEQIGNSYDQATAGANVQLDPKFFQDLGNVAQASRMLPPDRYANFAQVMDNRVGPIAQAGSMTGDAYQQAVRGIKGSRSGASGAAPGFEEEYRAALMQAQDALTSQMQRGGGQSVTDGLARADEAYRMAKTAQKASMAATNGPFGAQVFTPAQLNTAAKASQVKYGGKRPFRQLGDAGQAVLPSRVPNSGTADRIAALALPGVAGGAGYASDGTAGAGTSAAGTLALLAALNTKAGQKTLQKLLIDRPDTLRRVGKAVNKKKGLFGSATLPFLLEGN